MDDLEKAFNSLPDADAPDLNQAVDTAAAAAASAAVAAAATAAEAAPIPARIKLPWSTEYRPPTKEK